MWVIAAVAAALLATTAQAADCGVPTGSASLTDPMWMDWHNQLVGNVNQRDGPDVRTLTVSALF